MPLHERPVMPASISLAMFALVLGIRVCTDEFRHGSIVPPLVVAPVQSRVVAAKVATSAAAGTLLGGVLPEHVLIVACQPEKCDAFEEGLSPSVGRSRSRRDAPCSTARRRASRRPGVTAASLANLARYSRIVALQNSELGRGCVDCGAATRRRTATC